MKVCTCSPGRPEDLPLSSPPLAWLLGPVLLLEVYEAVRDLRDGSEGSDGGVRDPEGGGVTVVVPQVDDLSER